MSEYSRRIFAFSAIAVILAIGLSVSIALLPSMMATSSITTRETQSMTTVPSAVSSAVSSASAATITVTTTGSVYSATSTITTGTIVTTIPETTVTASTSTAITTGSVSFSSTAPCGSPGVYCGSATVTSSRLKVGQNSSMLQFTLTEIGNEYIGSATVYVNGTVIGTPPASQYEPPGNIMLNVQPDQSTVLVLIIPSSTISVNVGLTYSLMVYAWLGVLGQPANSGFPISANVTAT